MKLSSHQKNEIGFESVFKSFFSLSLHMWSRNEDTGDKLATQGGKAQQQTLNWHQNESARREAWCDHFHQPNHLHSSFRFLRQVWHHCPAKEPRPGADVGSVLSQWVVLQFVVGFVHHDSCAFIHHDSRVFIHHDSRAFIHHDSQAFIHHDSQAFIHHDSQAFIHHDSPAFIHHDSPAFIHHDSQAFIHHGSHVFIHHDSRAFIHHD